MRVIGHLPTEASAIILRDYLYVLGIGNEIDQEAEGWGIWIHSEDEIDKAKEILEAYRRSPDDPKYRRQAAQAGLRRAREASEEQAAEERVMDRTQVFRASMPYGAGALTTILIALCVIIHVLKVGGYEGSVLRELCMTEVFKEGDMIRYVPHGLREIREGEFWRLLTPILAHGDWLHLFFNMMWLFSLGSLIEARQSTGKLGLLVVVVGVGSNLGQYFWKDACFFGMSGVIYGLLGYVWMKAKLDPASGLFVHPYTVAMMLIWFVLCLSPVVPNVANGAHAVGLAMGVLWGFLESLPRMLRRA